MVFRKMTQFAPSVPFGNGSHGVFVMKNQEATPLIGLALSGHFTFLTDAPFLKNASNCKRLSDVVPELVTYSQVSPQELP